MNKQTLREAMTEVFYECDPSRATTCEKRTCYLNGGNCSLTLNPEWGKRRVRCDKGGLKK